MALEAFGVQVLEIIRPEIGVGTVVAEDVIEDDEHTMGDRSYGFLLAPPTRHAMELRSEVVVCGMGDGPGDLPKHRAQPRIALCRRAAEPPTAALFVAGADPSPGSQMLGQRRPRGSGSSPYRAQR